MAFAQDRSCSARSQSISALAWSADTAKILGALKAPAGFSVSVYADNVPGARSMALGDRGTLFIGTQSAGKVYAVHALAEGRQQVTTIAQGLTLPNGVAFHDGALYVAELKRILRYDAIEGQLDAPPKPVVVRNDFPGDRHHGWKYIAFGPDGKLYVPIGAPCNVCDQKGYALITRMNADGTWPRSLCHAAFATRWASPGIRRPRNSGSRTTGATGWARTYRRMSSTARRRRASTSDSRSVMRARSRIRNSASWAIARRRRRRPASSARTSHALGLKFYTGTQFPEAYRNQIFIPEHGSWNRKERAGYRVTLVRLDGNKATSYEPFITGWNQPDGVLGRPADLLIMPDGSLLVSDDLAGVIYRVSYGPAG